MKNKQSYIIVSGNPLDGLFFYGPYETEQEAITEAEQFEEDWWIACVEQVSK